MMFPLNVWLAAVLAIAACQSTAAGFNVGVEPGAATFSGAVSEWPVPTPKFARDPAIGPGGIVYFSVKLGDKIVRFDPKSKCFHEWIVPGGMRPQALVVARDGKVVFGGTGLGELDPSTGTVKQYENPSKGVLFYSLVLGAHDNIWFTERNVGKLGRLERSTGKMTEYQIGSDPYGLALDQRGNVWVTRKAADRVAKFDPTTGQITELVLSRGSRPRRITAAPDGMLWVTLYGVGTLLKIDPVAGQVVKEYPLPGGPNGGPYAVNADAAGRIWVSEIQTDSVIMLDPRSETVRVFKLPTRDTGIRNAAIDADGRYWYVGSMSGKLGVIE
ncbi:MAG: Vgb family protein [Ramlibacter sp.]